jgi:ribosomal-protein-alanine N-acetyltransferase
VQIRIVGVPTRIREYRPEDFDQLWRLDQACFAPGIAYSRFELMYYIRGRRAFTLVADGANDKILGFVVAECRSAGLGSGRTSSSSAGHVITIDVCEEARRSGVGTMLMDAVENRLRELGCEVAYLETSVDNARAISFYKRRGYTVLSTIPRYYLGKLDALVMGKKLVLQQRQTQRS